MTTPTAPDTEITDDQFEMLRTAVTITRNESIRRLAQLRARLNGLYPGRAEDVNAALRFWSKNLQERYPNGVPA